MSGFLYTPESESNENTEEEANLTRKNKFIDLKKDISTPILQENIELSQLTAAGLMILIAAFVILKRYGAQFNISELFFGGDVVIFTTVVLCHIFSRVQFFLAL